MSYQGILVDKARKVERRVGHRNTTLGESEFVEQVGEWNKVRLVTPNSSESRSDNTAAQESIQAELLMLPDFDLSINDRVEVDSRELGRYIWIVQGEPNAMRKKRSVLGKTVALKRVSNL